MNGNNGFIRVSGYRNCGRVNLCRANVVDVVVVVVVGVVVVVVVSC